MLVGCPTSRSTLGRGAGFMVLGMRHPRAANGWPRAGRLPRSVPLSYYWAVNLAMSPQAVQEAIAVDADEIDTQAPAVTA